MEAHNLSFKMYRRTFCKAIALIFIPFKGFSQIQFLSPANLPFFSSESTAVTGVSSITFAHSWANRVVSNGGAMPSSNTITAADTFYNGLSSDNLLSKVRTVNIIAPDNLIAAQTPFIVGGGNDPWTNHNFLSGDLTVSGLVGNGSTKYLESGIIPGSSLLTSTSAGIVVYISVDDATSTQSELGCYGLSDSSFFGIYAHYNTSSTFFGCWRFLNSGTDFLTWTAPSPSVGYYSGQRTSSTAFSLYFANSSAAHAALVTGSGTLQTGSIETTRPMYVFASNNNAVSPVDFSKKRVSFVAVTSGLVSTDSSALYSRVQTLRTSLGGGFV